MHSEIEVAGGVFFDTDPTDSGLLKQLRGIAAFDLDDLLFAWRCIKMSPISSQCHLKALAPVVREKQ